MAQDEQSEWFSTAPADVGRASSPWSEPGLALAHTEGPTDGRSPSSCGSKSFCAVWLPVRPPLLSPVMSGSSPSSTMSSAVRGAASVARAGRLSRQSSASKRRRSARQLGGESFVLPLHATGQVAAGLAARVAAHAEAARRTADDMVDEGEEPDMTGDRRGGRTGSQTARKLLLPQLEGDLPSVGPSV